MRQIIKLTLFCLALSPLLLAADHRFVKIDFPNSVFTDARGINARGDIVGRYTDANDVSHGFLLRQGVFTSIDVPNAAVTLGAKAIDARGDIVGSFLGEDSILHGYLLRDGQFTQIDYPGASGSFAFGINNAGDIAGSHFDAAGIEHGFLLKDGTFRNIHVPGSSCEHVGMAQDNGQVLAGSFCNAHDGMLYGFVRNLQGEFQTINFPGTGLICTDARWINERGDVVGPYIPVDNPDECLVAVKHGYLMRQGQFITIDPPGAIDSQAEAINDDGQIVGLYTDRAGLTHGYAAIPKDKR